MRYYLRLLWLKLWHRERISRDISAAKWARSIDAGPLPEARAVAFLGWLAEDPANRPAYEQAVEVMERIDAECSKASAAEYCT